MTLRRWLIAGFGLLALVGGWLASGRAGEGGWQMAFGITFLVAGGLGLLNVLMFTRLKASLDRLAEDERAAPEPDDAP